MRLLLHIVSVILSSVFLPMMIHGIREQIGCVGARCDEIFDVDMSQDGTCIAACTGGSWVTLFHDDVLLGWNASFLNASDDRKIRALRFSSSNLLVTGGDALRIYAHTANANFQEIQTIDSPIYALAAGGGNLIVTSEYTGGVKIFSCNADDGLTLLCGLQEHVARDMDMFLSCVHINQAGTLVVIDPVLGGLLKVFQKTSSVDCWNHKKIADHLDDILLRGSYCALVQVAKKNALADFFDLEVCDDTEMHRHDADKVMSLDDSVVIHVPSGQFAIISDTERSVRIGKFLTEEMHALTSTKRIVRCLFSPDGTRLIVVRRDGKLEQYDLTMLGK